MPLTRAQEAALYGDREEWEAARAEERRREWEQEMQAGGSTIDPWQRISEPRDPLQDVRTYLGLTEPELASDGADPWDSLFRAKSELSIGQPVYLGSDGLLRPYDRPEFSLLGLPVVTSQYLPPAASSSLKPAIATPAALSSLLGAVAADCRRLWSTTRTRLSSQLTCLRTALEDACDRADIEYHLPRVVRVQRVPECASRADKQNQTHKAWDRAVAGSDYTLYAYVMNGRVLMSEQVYASIKLDTSVV